MGASILDPLQIDIESATELCEEEPEMVKCDILKERLEEKRLEREGVELFEHETEYVVFSANFE